MRPRRLGAWTAATRWSPIFATVARCSMRKRSRWATSWKSGCEAASCALEPKREKCEVAVVSTSAKPKKFEEELKDLEEIVGKIDSGELTLQASISAFERRVALVRG